MAPGFVISLSNTRFLILDDPGKKALESEYVLELRALPSNGKSDPFPIFE